MDKRYIIMRRVVASSLICFAIAVFLLTDVYAQCKGNVCPTKKLFIIEEYGKCGYINNKGEKIVHPEFSACGEYFKGRAWVGLNGKFGFIDEKGEYVVALRSYGINNLKVYPFYEDLAKICDLTNTDNPRCGVIDQNGNILVPMKFFSIAEFSEGRAFVVRVESRTNDGWSEQRCEFIDRTGRIVFTHKDPCSNHWHEGLLSVNQVDRTGPYPKARWGSVDRSGKVIIEPQYDYEFPFWGGMATVYEGGSGHIIDKTGKRLMSFRRELLAPSHFFSEGLIAYKDKRRNKMGFMDINGSTIIEPAFDGVGWFQEGLAWVANHEDEKWGFIDKRGRVVIPLRFAWVGSFEGGLAPVRDDWKQSASQGYVMGHVGNAYINTKGEVVWKRPSWTVR